MKIKDNTRKHLRVFFLAVGLILPSACVYPAAAGPWGEEGISPERHLGRTLSPGESNLYDGRYLLKLKEDLGLTAEQEEKIENLMLKHETSLIRGNAEIKIKELQFASYLKSGKMDRNEVEKHIRAISSERTGLLVHYINYLLDLREVLTREQLEKMTHLREKRKEEKKRQWKKPGKEPSDCPSAAASA